jgi:cyclophilin family peptidyl-prolyl cis-trans isomerase
MAQGTNRWRAAVWTVTAVALVGTAGLAGCSKNEPKVGQADDQPAPKPVARNVAPETKKDAAPDAVPNDAEHRPFQDVVRADVPDDVNPPPDVTVTGKSVGKLYTEVARTWSAVRYVNAKGQRIDYTAHLETDLGTITIALRPDIAPNHVRNFIVLARLGYYDGLPFDSIHDEPVPDKPGIAVKTIEAGSPSGTGDYRTGHLGYWLRPELARADSKVVHEEGTVGACHGAEADTACCRFYITLAPAPTQDGNYTIFGKITDGIQVARTISARPTISEEQEDGEGRLKDPVIIRKVTIKERLSGGSSPADTPL